MVFVSHSISLSKFLFYFILCHYSFIPFVLFNIIFRGPNPQIGDKESGGSNGRARCIFDTLPCHLFLSLIYLFVCFLDSFLFDFQGCVHT